VVGAGYVGAGVVRVLTSVDGVYPAIIVNRDPERAVAVFESLGISRDDILVGDDMAQMAVALDSRQPIVTSSIDALAGLPVGLVIEATGAIDHGARVIMLALQAGRDVISYNAEVDALLGALFHRVAGANDAIYTIADGDQPGALLRLQQQVHDMGFEVRSLLNCKRHLNRHQNPSSGAAYTARDTTSSHMTTAFGDGTKMQVEQAVVANATGIAPDRQGMHGLRTTQEEVLADAANHLPDGQCVDYTLGGDFAAGVGIIARHSDGDLHQRAMSLYKMGDGPDYFFFRPYHLVHLELPLTLADVLVHRKSLSRMDGGPVAEVVAVAKKPLGTGERLDCIGGFTAYGHIDSLEGARGLLPVGLLEYAVMTADVEQDQPIPLTAVQLDAEIDVVHLWRQLHSQGEAANEQVEQPSRATA